MKMKFSFKGVYKAASVAALMLVFLFVGNTASAQSLQGSQFSGEVAKDLGTIMEQYGSDYPTKPQVKDLLSSELIVLRDATNISATQEAINAVKTTFLIGLSTHVRSDVTIERAFLNAYSKAIVRAEDFSVNVNTLEIFEEYYDLFTL